LLLAVEAEEQAYLLQEVVGEQADFFLEHRI
jgi:hypothetical protein